MMSWKPDAGGGRRGVSEKKGRPRDDSGTGPTPSNPRGTQRDQESGVRVDYSRERVVCKRCTAPFSRPARTFMTECRECHGDTVARRKRIELDGEAGALFDQLGDMLVTALAMVGGSERATKAARLVQAHMRRRRGAP